MLVPGLKIDDREAFSDQTTGVPEVVVSMEGRTGKLRIRWYKLSSDATAAQWITALAARKRPPIALIGGGSSDRALELARALQNQKSWPGDRPLLFLTTATADSVRVERGLSGTNSPYLVNLIDVYDDRTFRFCFTNRQMAESVLEFVWSHPLLRPGLIAYGRGAVGSGLALSSRSNGVTGEGQPDVLGIVWNDDPFSRDLHEQFGDALRGKASLETWEVPYSVGGFNVPNFYEERVAESILTRCRGTTSRRSLIVLSTVTQPARRLLRTMAEADPEFRTRLVAVTGDGIPVNALYRDGSFAWPIPSLPVPLVLFTHHHPVDWDSAGRLPIPPPGYALHPPNSTEDVRLFTEITRIMTEACFLPGTAQGQLVHRADELAERLRSRSPTLFDSQGNRLGGTGEFVAVLWPQPAEQHRSAPDSVDAFLEVWQRGQRGRWESIQTVPVFQRQAGLGSPVARGSGE